MTRILLSLFVSAAALAAGLGASCLQSENHAQADRLDWLHRQCDLVRAGNEGIEAEIMARHFDFERGELFALEVEPGGVE